MSSCIDRGRQRCGKEGYEGRRSFHVLYEVIGDLNDFRCNGENLSEEVGDDYVCVSLIVRLAMIVWGFGFCGKGCRRGSWVCGRLIGNYSSSFFVDLLHGYVYNIFTQ